MSILTTALLGYFVLLAGVTMVRSVPVKSPLVQRLRMFFPSWRFFEDLGSAPVLLVRFDDGAWQLALPPLRPPWYAVFFNPEANVRLAAASLVEQLVSELEVRAESAAEPCDDESAAERCDDESAAEPCDDEPAAEPCDDESAAERRAGESEADRRGGGAAAEKRVDESPADDCEVAELASYRLVENLVRECLREARVWRPGLRYAFKIVYVEQGTSWRSGEDAVISPEMRAPDRHSADTPSPERVP